MSDPTAEETIADYLLLKYESLFVNFTDEHAEEKGEEDVEINQTAKIEYPYLPEKDIIPVPDQ